MVSGSWEFAPRIYDATTGEGRPMFGPEELRVDHEGHRVWKYPVVQDSVPLPPLAIGSAHWQDQYALFVGYELRAGESYAVYSTRPFLLPS